MAGDSIRSVDRALDILDAFSTRDGPLTLTELSRRIDLNKSTTSRLLQTLEQRRFVTRLASGAYRPGPALSRLGNVFRASLQFDEQVLPILQRLTETTGESSACFVREGDMRRCHMRVESSRSVRDQLEVGMRVPLGPGSYGRVLSFFESVGNRAPTASVVVATAGEREPKMASIAAPVFGQNQQLLAAIGISLPLFRFNREFVESAAPAVLNEAIELTELLGGDPSYLKEAANNGYEIHDKKP